MKDHRQKKKDENFYDFQEIVKNIKKLSHNKTRLLPKKTVVVKSKPLAAEPSPFSESLNLPDVTGDAYLSFKRDGVPHKTLRKLRKGQYNVAAILDLHGHSVEEAKSALSQFLIKCLQREVRVALVIHGKGRHSAYPILKNKLNHWLRETKMVLAFCSATQQAGNRGAVYILLKHISGED